MTLLTGTLTATDAAGKTAVASYSVDKTATQPPSGIDDGSANAPSGAAIYPNLLKAYAKRSPLKVAGVDYRAGPPEGQVFKDPRTNGALSWDSASRLWWVMQNNVTLDGYDFSPYPGTIYPYQSGKSDNFVLRNSKMGRCEVSSRANNITIENNDFDGAQGSSIFVNLNNTGPSKVILRYNRLRNFYQHSVELQGIVTSLLYAYNLIEDGGQDPGGQSHLNILQNQTNLDDSKILFNTFLQHYTPSHGEGFQLYTTASRHVAELAYNTMIALKGPNGEASVSTMVNNAQSVAGMTTQNVHDNYVDPTGLLSTIFAITSSNQFNTINNFANNYRMTDGSLITGTGK